MNKSIAALVRAFNARRDAGENPSMARCSSRRNRLAFRSVQPVPALHIVPEKIFREGYFTSQAVASEGDATSAELKTFYWCRGTREQEEKTTLGTGDDVAALAFIAAIEIAAGRVGFRRLAASLAICTILVAGVAAWGGARLTAAMAAPSEMHAAAAAEPVFHESPLQMATPGASAPSVTSRSDALAGLQQQAARAPQGPQFRPVDE